VGVPPPEAPATHLRRICDESPANGAAIVSPLGSTPDMDSNQRHISAVRHRERLRVRRVGWMPRFVVRGSIVVVAVISALLPPAFGTAGATPGVPVGQAPQPMCASTNRSYHITGLDDTEKVSGLWVPAGATVDLVATGSMTTSLYWGLYRAEYAFHVLALGGQFASFADVGWWPPASAEGPAGGWYPFPGLTYGHFTNTTGAPVRYQLKNWGARTFAGAGVRWESIVTVTGGDGSADPLCAALRPDGAARGDSAPGNLRVSDPVDTATGNLYHGFTDLDATASLPGLAVQRSYNSTDTDGAALGSGWTEAYGATATDFVSYADVKLDDGRVVRFPANAAGTGFDRPQELAAELSRDPDSSLRLTFNGGVVWEFDTAGRLEKTTDAAGVSATVVRDGSGLVSTVTSSAGTAPNQPKLSFSYSGGFLVSIAATDGRSVSYGYTSGRLTSFTDAAGKVWAYGYDAAGALSTVTDPTGVVLMSTVYGSSGRVVLQTTPDGGEETFSYDDVNRITTHTVVATGEVLKYVHDTNGRVVQIIDPNNKTTGKQVGSFGFWNQSTTRTGVTRGSTLDARANVSATTDPASGPTSATYDSQDRPLTITTAASGTTTYSYAGSGTSEIPSSETDALGKVTTRTITNGLVMSETDPDGVVRSYTYSPTRQVLTSTVGGATTTMEYWPQGWLKKVTSPEGRATSYTYDGEGRVLTVTAPGNAAGTTEVTTYTYDGAGRLLTTTDPTGAVTTRTYDSLGRLATESLPGKLATTYGYDALGQLTTVTDPTGVVTETHYGVLGRVEWTKDGAGRQTNYSYFDDGQLWKTTAPDGGVTENTYDSAGRLWKVKDPMARVTTTTYNAAGQVWKVTAPDGGVTETEYDAVGRVKKVTDPTGRISQTTYTDAGRTQTTTDAAGVVTTLTYDSSGRAWKSADPLGNTTITEYWPDGLVKKQTSPSGLATNVAYNNAGRQSVVTDPAGVTSTTTWSARGERLAEQISGRGPKQFLFNPDGTMAWSKDERGNQTTYAYDGAGRSTGRVTPVATEGWGYVNGEMVSYIAPPVGGVARVTLFGRDAAGRVNAVADPSGRAMNDTFNAAGDLTGRVFTQGGSTLGFTYGYDSAGRQNSAVTPDGTFTKTFDLAGRLLSVNPVDNRYMSYSYDSGGRVSQVTTPEGLELVYGYDAAGRVQKISPNSTMVDWFNGANAAGADPSKWTRQAVGGGSAAIDGNRLRLSTTATAGSSMGVTSTAPQTADSVTTVSFQAASSAVGNQSRFTVGVRQNAANTAGYRVEFTTDSTTAKLIKRVAGTDTVLGTFTAPTPGTEIRTQIEVSGSTVRAKVWPASGSAPGTWGVSVTDTSITAAGATQVRTDRVAGSNSVAIDSYRQRNNQGSALAPFVTNTYNADSQVTTEAFPSGSRVNTFTAGRLTKQVQTVPGADRTTDVTYDSAGAYATTAVGGVTTTYGYDASGQLLSATPSTGAALEYTYDGAGRRATSKVGSVTTSYTYNSASQLTAVTPAAGSATSMTYDLAGRRLTETTGSAVTTNTYDQAGRLAGIAKTNAGTVVTSEARKYTPEGLLRMDTVTGPGGGFLRALKYDWDTNTGGLAQMVSTLDGETNFGLVRNNGTWAASTKGGTPTLFGSDVFGSVINSTGQTLANATGWDPYGNPTGATATNAARFGYRGELTVLGDTYLRARNYQNTTGTFTTVDPLDDVAATSTSGNRYHYSYNDPINRQDPSGLRPGEPDHEHQAGRPTGSAGASAAGSSDRVRRSVEDAIKRCPAPEDHIQRATTKWWYDIDFAARTCTLTFNGKMSNGLEQLIVDYQTEITVGLAVVAVAAAAVAVAAGGGAVVLSEAGKASVEVVAGGSALVVGVAVAGGVVTVVVGGVIVVLRNLDAAGPSPQTSGRGGGSTTTSTPSTCGATEDGPDESGKGRSASPVGEVLRDGAVKVVIYSNDHGPPHAHVKGGGPETRVGQNGKPLNGDPELTRAQRQVVEKHLKEIRDAIREYMRWFGDEC